MKIKNLFLVALVNVVGISAFAANQSKKLIVKLQAGENISMLEEQGYHHIEALIPELRIYTVEAPAAFARAGLKNVAADLRLQHGVVYAQEDHPVTRRSAPNDKKFGQQWDMLKDSSNWGIDALGAWDNFGTKGIDARGSEIVVAVVDGGVDIKHEDLVENIWVNKNEIPNNGIDDDQNGFIDDVNGWNAYNGNGKIPVDEHGTHVAGTVGARGNNGLEGAGINWNVKIMPVGGASSQTSIVLKAYGYVLAQKKLWLQSNGLQGANIVATNSSFGVDWADCKSSTYAVWNDIYNEMGKVGILHAIATVNSTGDVDKRGDVPTSCDSPYIISVTNTQQNGTKYNSAAFGKTTIDIGAPGTDIYSTLPSNRWGSNTGTSMASPHVAGAVAFMHSVASTKFNDMYYTDPAGAALLLKEQMLKAATPTKDLADRTVSGGMLNLNNAAKSISTL